MESFWGILAEAVSLILAWDPDLIEIIGLCRSRFRSR